MTADPTMLPAGRELDEAVARAIGAYREECDGSQGEMAGNSCDGWVCTGCGVVWGRWGEDMKPHAGFRNFSTNYAALPEMLEWITAHAHHVLIDVYAKFATARVQMNDGHLVGANGKLPASDTLPLAVCRAVLALKAWIDREAK